MVPGIFNHMQIEHDSSDDDAFGRKKKSGKKNSLTELVDGMSQSLHNKAGGGGDSNSDDDDADMFSVPMNSDAFMAKIAQQ